MLTSEGEKEIDYNKCVYIREEYQYNDIGELEIYGESEVNEIGQVLSQTLFVIEDGQLIKEQELRWHYFYDGHEWKRKVTQQMIYNGQEVTYRLVNEYDECGKLSKELSLHGTNGTLSNYLSYDDYGNCVEVLIQEIGTESIIVHYVCEYLYDQRGNILSAKALDYDTKTVINETQYEYSKDGILKSTSSSGNGSTSKIIYNKNGDIVHMSTYFEETYIITEYDDCGNLTEETSAHVYEDGRREIQSVYYVHEYNADGYLEKTTILDTEKNEIGRIDYSYREK